MVAATHCNRLVCLLAALIVTPLAWTAMSVAQESAEEAPAPTSRPAIEAIGPGSILLIEIQEFRDLSVPARMLREVEADGTVGIGMDIRTEAAGKTPAEIRKALADGLRRQDIMPGGEAFLTVSHWREPSLSPFPEQSIGPGDFLEIDQTMTGLLPSGRSIVRVDGDGQVMLPLLEETIDATGLSVQELELLYMDSLVEERIARKDVADAVLIRRLSRDEAERMLERERSLETNRMLR